MPARDHTVEELRTESERSRAALTNTVVELRERVSVTADDLKTRLSPAHLKEEVKDYVRGGSEQFFHSIERKARENPLQAVAIGAGLAYPLWGIMRSIPVPIMLIGAGLWLSRQKTGSGNGEQGLANKAKAGAAEGVSRVTESMRGAGAAIAAAAEGVSDKVRATAHDIRDSVTEMGHGVAGIVKDKTTDAADTVSSAASDLGAKVTQFGNRSRNTFEDLVDRNPLLVAGVGLAIGVMDEMTGAAAREGLDGEGLAKAVEGATERVKSVVDKGVKTALGETEASSAPRSPNSFQSNS
jgi:ElaB/YqjD/DUF883 family membrane-anchored ribosome-binding protein